MTILCLASYEKGHEFLRECKRQGWTVVLVTAESIRHTSDWPMEAIDEIFYLPDTSQEWDPLHMRNAVSYLARTRVFDRIVPLDDFDVQLAALIREHLRIPGMGQTTAHHFRDKLAMRMRAREAGLTVPDFIHVLNHGKLAEFMNATPAPWVLKPRSMAGAIGIRKIHSAEEFWPIVEALGDQQSNFLLERFVPGSIFHVDTIMYESQVRFAIASSYGAPPLEVAQGGGIFTTRVMQRDSETARRLVEENERVLRALGLLRGVSHTEFIVGRDDGKVYFLETSARVGGAHIAELIEAATGINLWAEWAKVELAGGKQPYEPPPARQDYAGLLVSLARQERPDTSPFNDPELVWRMDKPHHVGFIVRSNSQERVQQLLNDYSERVARDYHASVPARDRPGH
ncbi:MAG TPA: ATP-grasp domain-containing protein [Bryobacteraceae bacterium]|nr:ATP-grasp domain-containing protein [Bryobacteraceae bacterium]